VIGKLSLSEPACRSHFLSHGALAVLLDLCEPRDKEAMSRNTGVGNVLLICCSCVANVLLVTLLTMSRNTAVNAASAIFYLAHTPEARVYFWPHSTPVAPRPNRSCTNVARTGSSVTEKGRVSLQMESVHGHGPGSTMERIMAVLSAPRAVLKVQLALVKTLHYLLHDLARHSSPMSSPEPPVGVRGERAGGGPLNGVACDGGGGQEGRGIVGEKGGGKEGQKGQGKEDVAKMGVSFMCGKAGVGVRGEEEEEEKKEEAKELRESLVKSLWEAEGIERMTSRVANGLLATGNVLLMCF
jgi:hypothetical protein